MSKSFIMIILILLISAAIVFVLFSNKPAKTNVFNIKNNQYQLEIATTAFQKAKGLSGRNNLCPKCGMLFVFQNDSTQQFWMKDTLIPLDIIWINGQGKVVSIQTAQPEPGVVITQLKIYKNDAPAKYVLELNAGESQKIGLQVGDSINLTNINE